MERRVTRQEGSRGQEIIIYVKRRPRVCGKRVL
jgi:hypothetical protein